MTLREVSADPYRFPACADLTDLLNSQGNSPKISVQSRPVFLGRDGIPGAGDQMQASRSVRAFLPHPAGLADVARKNEPHTRERDVLLRRQTVNYALENVVCRASFADFQSD
jgi:hypothetical protein